MEKYWIVAELQPGINGDNDSIRFIEQYETRTEAKELQLTLNRLDVFFSTYIIIPPKFNHILQLSGFTEIHGRAFIDHGYLENIEETEETK